MGATCSEEYCREHKNVETGKFILREPAILQVDGRWQTVLIVSGWEVEERKTDLRNFKIQEIIPTIGGKGLKGKKTIQRASKTNPGLPEIFTVDSANSGGRMCSSSDLLPSQLMISIRTRDYLTLESPKMQSMLLHIYKGVHPQFLGPHFLILSTELVSQTMTFMIFVPIFSPSPICPSS